MSASVPFKRHALTTLLFTGLFGIAPAWAQSIVSDGTTGTLVTPNGNRLDITDGTLSEDGTNQFHSFQRFGLNSGETANFISNPSIQNILTRVTGGDASIINGLIQVTGGNPNVYLMNPAGIIFGANATLNVSASFTATTATAIAFDRGWFNAAGGNNYAELVGNPRTFTFTTSQPGAIVNAGYLAVSQGQNLALLGGTVVNTGQLIAPGGSITIATVPGENLVRISQPGHVLSLEVQPVADGSQPGNWTIPVRSLPELLTGGGGSVATGLRVNGNGQVELTSSGVEIPSQAGTTIASGSFDVSTVGAQGVAPSPQVGGNVNIVGDKVGLISANINASGTNGGGTVLIGGDYKGQGTVPNATSTFVSRDSFINVGALSTGNGGKVIAWADDSTRFYGTISARGGVQGGNGGFVETSGKRSLDINEASVDAGASYGQAGTWLLDPSDITIATGGTGTLTGEIFAPPTNQTIAPVTIENALAGGTSVTLTTAGGTGGNGDIFLNSSINATATNNATLRLTGRYLTPFNNSTININGGNLIIDINAVNPTPTSASPTIQNAINSVGTVTGDRTINLGAGTYIPVNTLTISKSMTLRGAGANNTIVSGNNAFRVFEITGGDVTVDSLTIRDGFAKDTVVGPFPGFFGGGILHTGTSTLTITNTTISGNTASSSSNQSFGGGIFNYWGTLNIINSTISGNTVSSSNSGGGGIHNQSGKLNITNSTISSNTVSGGGGGINNVLGTLTITNSTITLNRTGNGGGVFNSPGGTINVRNTIIAGNTNISVSTSPDVSGTFIDQGNNLIGKRDGSTGFTLSTLVGTIANPIDPKLGPLQNNGGSTQTHALLPGSPAINAGVSVAGVTTDQRSVSRTGNGNPAPDIGAYEVSASPSPTPSPTPSPIPSPSLTGQQQAQMASTLTPTSVPELPNFKPQDLIPPSSIVRPIEQIFIGEFEQYLGIRETPMKILTDFGYTLRGIEKKTGLKPGVIYAVFVPPSPVSEESVNSVTSCEDLAQQPTKRLTNSQHQDSEDQLLLILVTTENQAICKRVEGTTRKQVLNVARQLRREITDIASRPSQYLPPAKKMYQWLVAPLEKDLQVRDIQNLVFILDVGLRSVPLAALHDDRGFLIEKYSVGLMPSFDLTNTLYTDIKNSQVLAMGVSEFTNKMPLPAVPVELSTITPTLWPGQFFLNKDFTLENLKSQRLQRPFGIIHLATHALFKPGDPGNSYIQLSDTQLKMNQLRQFGWNDAPVELLVLSACQTAQGNEEAELGFAGLAIQAGVKSALASLWFVSDEGTMALMTKFYQELKQAPTRSEALRRAQLAMLKGQVRLENGKLVTPRGVVSLPPELAMLGNQTLSHPKFWSAFTMVGNPW